MKSIIAAGLLLCLSMTVIAQNSLIPDAGKRPHLFPDSIRIEFPEQHGLIVFQLVNYRLWQGQLDKDFALVRQVVETIEKASSSTTAPKTAEARIPLEGEIKITFHDPDVRVTRVTAGEKGITELLPPGWEIRCHLAMRAEIYIYAQTFEELKKIVAYSPEAMNRLLTDQAAKQYVGRKRYIARAIVQKDEIVFNDIKFQMPLDLLEINGSAGLGYLKSGFYPELNGVLTFQFGNRMNVPKTRLSLIYNNLFFTALSSEGKFSNRTNSFLSVAYSHSFGSVRESTWLSLGAGYLIQKRGDYFSGKTAKFFFSTTVGKFAIVPEFYLTNDFKSFQSGLKFSYTF